MTEGIHTDEAPGTATAQPRRRAGQFARLPIAQAALRFASARHAHQYREIDHAPFIAHPIEVGSLLRRDGQPDEMIAAELLRDVLEKTATTSAELHHRFGAQIARVVESVSDDPSLGDHKSRKRELRDRVAHAGPGTCAVFAVDKIAKVRELSLPSAWQLNEPRNRAKLAHYRASLEMLQRVDGGDPLVDRLDAEPKQLLTPASAELSAPERSRTPPARSPASVELPRSESCRVRGSTRSSEWTSPAAEPPEADAEVASRARRRRVACLDDLTSRGADKDCR